MVQNGSSSTLSSHPLHLLTVLVLLTLVLFSGLWSQPICGLFTFNGLKLKLSFVSVCVLGRGGFQRAGKVVALQGWEGWDRKEGFQFSFLFFSFYKWNQGGSFFRLDGLKGVCERGSSVCLCICVPMWVKPCLMGTITSVADASHTCVLQIVAGETHRLQV